MKIQATLVLSVFLLCSSALAFERGLLNMDTPYPFMGSKAFELSLNHRFYGKAFEDEPFETLFGMDGGANVGIGIRYFYSGGLDFQLSHVRAGKQYLVGMGWNRELGRSVTSYVFAGYVTEEESPGDGRKDGFQGSVSISAPSPIGNMRPVVEYLYDGIGERHGLGLGLELGVSSTVALFGEYFPVLDRDGEDAGTVLPEDAFDFGARVVSSGHQFIFSLGNGQGVGLRDQLDGAAGKDLYLGFSIRRLFGV